MGQKVTIYEYALTFHISADTHACWNLILYDTN